MHPVRPLDDSHICRGVMHRLSEKVVPEQCYGFLNISFESWKNFPYSLLGPVKIIQVSVPFGGAISANVKGVLPHLK